MDDAVIEAMQPRDRIPPCPSCSGHQGYLLLDVQSPLDRSSGGLPSQKGLESTGDVRPLRHPAHLSFDRLIYFTEKNIAGYPALIELSVASPTLRKSNDGSLQHYSTGLPLKVPGMKSIRSM